MFNSIQTELKEINTSLLKTQDVPKDSVLYTINNYVFQRQGKLIRASLVLALSKALSPKNNIHENIYKLALLTELMHTASLVHDDVLDNSDERRGQNAVHLRWNNKVAILAGDFLFARCSILLSEIDCYVSNIYARVLLNLCHGEVQQAQNKHNINILSWQEYTDRIRAKTAIMFSALSRSVAHINNLSKEQEELLFNFGDNLGLAFQIIDDYLDITQSLEQLGKPPMQDIQNGIYTAPVLYALENNNYKQELLDLLEDKKYTIEKLSRIKTILQESQSLEKTKLLAQDYINKAKDSIKFISENKYKTEILELCDYIALRSY